MIGCAVEQTAVKTGLENKRVDFVQVRCFVVLQDVGKVWQATGM